MKSTSLLGLLLTAAVSSAANIPKKGPAPDREDRLPKECGKSIKDGSVIINGVNATYGELPWMVLTGDGTNFTCGGTLISDRYILTAAHCGERKKVRLGAIFRKPDDEDQKHFKEVEVEKTIPHEKFNSLMNTNDISLLRLKNKVVFNDHIRPICLPSIDHGKRVFDGQKCQVAGWGRTKEGRYEPTSHRLMKANLTMTNLAECKKKIQAVYPVAVIDERVVCAGGPSKDTCQGDSGGPLYMRLDHQSESRWTQLGVTSWGIGCARGLSGVYTRVSSFRNWIIDHMV